MTKYAFLRTGSTQMHIDGGCHCGRITYTATIDPARVSICHCTACQTLTGSPFRLTAFSDRSTIEISGNTPRIYEKTGDSGRKRWMHFCANCGSPLFASGQNGAGEWGIRWGSISQRRDLKPVRQIWCGSALPWLADIPVLPDGGNP